MFISDKLCFVEFGKTGCSFIREVLKENIKSGQLTKIHDPITSDVLNSNRLKIGSIRNPYDWYISLWSFGCSMKKKDPLYSNLTSLRLNPKRLGNIKTNKIRKIFFFVDQFKKNLKFNKNLYSDSLDIDNFKKWIQILLDSKNKNFISEHYSISNTNKFIGYMTYHYLIKFTDHKFHHKFFNSNLKNIDDIKSFYHNYSYIDYFIRFEDLKNSIINLFKNNKIIFNEKELSYKKPVNKSHRLPKIEDYYDKETKELVEHYDKLIFDLHNY